MLMALFYRGENLVPLPFQIGTVSVHMKLQAGRPDDFLAFGDLFGNRNARPYRNDTEIGDDLHASPPISSCPRTFPFASYFMKGL